MNLCFRTIKPEYSIQWELRLVYFGIISKKTAAIYKIDNVHKTWHISLRS